MFKLGAINEIPCLFLSLWIKSKFLEKKKKKKEKLGAIKLIS